MAPYKTFLIAGPTASGKSGLALKLAQQFNGVIVNTDSMQVYRDLYLLSARPSAEDSQKAEHRLYGHVDAAAVFSTGVWLRSIEAQLSLWRSSFGAVIFTGGTGLYFNALTQGLSEIPEIPDQLRLNLRHQLAENGAEAMYCQLKAEDPATAVLLQPGDGQRIVRALEVFRHTGRPLRDWQNSKTAPLVDLDDLATKALVLDPDREFLAQKIEVRFHQMIKMGVIEEVAALIQRGLEPQLPAMKAIGVAELSAYLAGLEPIEAAVKNAVIASRQYAKRQRTWFRGQMDARWARFNETEPALKFFE